MIRGLAALGVPALGVRPSKNLLHGAPARLAARPPSPWGLKTLGSDRVRIYFTEAQRARGPPAKPLRLRAQ